VSVEEPYRSTQEWVRRFASETEAKEYAAKLEARALPNYGGQPEV
jgi:hypothetical protein